MRGWLGCRALQYYLGLGSGVGDADYGLAQAFLADADGAEVAAGGGAVWPSVTTRSLFCGIEWHGFLI